MKQPLVSVVMPVYNIESYVEESIHSILSQTYSNFEFIIINDGSIDNTANIVKNVHDNRIIFIDSSENKGNYNRRNEGCRLAKGKYICVMDGDDVASPARIEKQVEIMENDSLLSAHGTAFTFPNGYICRKPSDYNLIKVLLLFNNMFLHPSLIVRKEVMEVVGYYDEKYYYSSDYDLVCKIALQGKIVNIPDILMKYRVHEKQISSAHYAKQTEYANQIRLDYMERCGFDLSMEEKEVFTLLITDMGKAKEQNENIRSIINKLERQNQETKCFDSDLFVLFLKNFSIPTDK
jgi:glycosyltransferase involved in cell wall biosynthesis